MAEGRQYDYRVFECQNSIAMILALSFPTHFHLKSYNIQRSFICKSRNSHRCITYIIMKSNKENEGKTLNTMPVCIKFAKAATIKFHRLGCVNNTNWFFFSQFYRLEVQKSRFWQGWFLWGVSSWLVDSHLLSVSSPGPPSRSVSQFPLLTIWFLTSHSVLGLTSKT